jgi:hypothetical protein
MDVDPSKSVAMELERYVSELTTYTIKNLSEQQQNDIYGISKKILLMRRYFPLMELPSKHERLLKSQSNS